MPADAARSAILIAQVQPGLFAYQGPTVQIFRSVSLTPAGAGGGGEPAQQ